MLGAVGLVVDQLLLAVDAVDATPVSVSGRILDARNGVPVPGAWIMSLPRTALANDDAHIAMWRGLIALEGPVPLYAGDFSDQEGRFSFVVSVPWSWRAGGLTGLSFSRRTPPPFHGLGCILIDADGYGRTTIDPKSGIWSTRLAEDRRDSSLDLGVIGVAGDK